MRRRLRFAATFAPLIVAALGCNAVTGVGDLELGEATKGSTEGAGGGTTDAASGAGATTTATGTTGATTATSTSASTSASTSVASSSSTGGGNDAAQLCVDTINQYRASLGLPPYARWIRAESCADSEAKSDSQTGEAHGAFGQCGESAQNECPGWPGPPENMIASCLELMWNEGPGADFNTHGHYINMSSTQYTRVACGYSSTSAESLWAVQDFQ
jgi:hypothetical protein